MRKPPKKATAIAWQVSQRWPSRDNVARAAPLDNRCAGSITTAGGLIFAGRFNGQLTALDSDTGQRLWSFQTDGGFTTTATTFEHEGVQYLAGIAGGGVTGGRLNDGLWLFSLNGTIESLPPGSGDPPPDDGDGNDETNDRRAFLTQLDLSRTPNLARGEEIYATVCTACHGPMGEGGHLGVPFKRELAVVDIVVTARSGVDGTSMPAFGGSFGVEELHDVASYIGEEILPLRKCHRSRAYRAQTPHRSSVSRDAARSRRRRLRWLQA